MSEVHCLVCDDVYEEQDTFIEKCPHCGNEETQLTAYLVPEEQR